MQLKATHGQQDDKLSKLVFLVLTALLTSLSFREWSFTDVYDFSTYSATMEALRLLGFYISGGLLLSTIGVFLYILPAGSIASSFGPMHLLLLLTLVTRIKKFTLGESASNIPQSIILSCCAVVTFGVLLPSVLRARVVRQVTIIGSLYASGLLWAALSIREWFLNPATVIWYARFHGISGHPNHAGVITAIASIAGIGLYLQARTKTVKIILLLSAIALSALTIWTDSRTAMLVECVGITCLILARGKALMIVSAVTIALVFMILYDTNADTEIGSEYRVLSTENTRIAVWDNMWNEFSGNWILGGNFSESSTENSFLLVLATTGIVGGSIFFGAMFLLSIQAYMLLGSRSWQAGPAEKASGAILIALLVGAVFEGNLRAEFSYPVFAVYLLTTGVINHNYQARTIGGSKSHARGKLWQQSLVGDGTL